MAHKKNTAVEHFGGMWQTTYWQRAACVSPLKTREWCVVVECDVISFRIDDNYRSALTGTVY